MPARTDRPLFKDDLLRPVKRELRPLLRDIEQAIRRDEDPTELLERLATRARELHFSAFAQGCRWVSDEDDVL